MKVVVFGGRNFGVVPPDTAPFMLVEALRKARVEAEALYAVLDKIHKERPITLVIHGRARGADLIGDEWARSRRVPVQAFPADWKKHHRAAGPLRNSLMVAESPDLAVGTPGGSGTEDMRNKVRAAGIELVLVQ